MIIETKLDVGDEVFFLQNDKVHTTEIAEVSTRTSTNGYGNVTTKYFYTITKNPAGSQYTINGFNDNELHKTKQELLDTL